jgi:hypothetical protein
VRWIVEGLKLEATRRGVMDTGWMGEVWVTRSVGLRRREVLKPRSVRWIVEGLELEATRRGVVDTSWTGEVWLFG